jgi:anaerobic ribonucleoside-triphosphate reductase activating protein
MRYNTIKQLDIANGPGCRVSLFVQGCSFNCPGCFNTVARDFAGGKEFTKETIELLLKLLEPSYISGLSILGGEPLHPRNRRDVLDLVSQVKVQYPEKTIWLYTGYKYEYLLFWECNIDVVGILKMCDVVVDGRYDKNLRDTSLKWRGSKNQRVIDMKKSLETGRCVLHCD